MLLLPGAHHHRVVRVLGLEPDLGAGPVGDELRCRRLGAVLGERALAAPDQVPERGRADRVGDQVDALVAGRVEHVVQSPGVEDPRLAGGHVHRALVADELDHRAGRDRDVDPHPVGPVVVGVDVQGRFRLALEPHQSRAAEDGLEARQHLLQVLALLQMRGREHRPGDPVVHRVAAEGDQRQGRVARMPLRMRAPVGLGDRCHLRLHPLDVELERQLDELGVELHGESVEEGRTEGQSHGVDADATVRIGSSRASRTRGEGRVGTDVEAGEAA